MTADGKLALGYLRVFSMTGVDLVGVDVVGAPGSISADKLYAIVRGLDEKRPRSKRVHSR